MNKSELIDAMAVDAGISKIEARKALDSFTKNVTQALKKRNKVSLIGFGTFSTSKREERKGVNPQNPKETIIIPAKTVAKFKPGSELADSVK